MDIQRLAAGGVGLVLTLAAAAGYYTGSDTLVVFTVNALHNHIHLASGVLGLVCALLFSGLHARLFNKWFGAIYALVGVLGFVLPSLMAEWLNIGLADNLLHLAIGLGLVYVAVKIRPEPSYN